MAGARSSGIHSEDMGEAEDDRGAGANVRCRTVVEYDESWTEAGGKGGKANNAASPMAAVLQQMQRLTDLDEAIGKRNEAQHKTLGKVVNMFETMQNAALERYGRHLQPGDEGWRAADAMPEEV